MANTSIHLTALVSDRDRAILEIVTYVFMAGAVCLFGITANIINIIVFYKQGFNSTATLSFLGLAISDLCSLVCMLWYCICANPLCINATTAMLNTEIAYLTAGLPHTCFTRTTGWITVFITAERCLCIVFPLKIKQIVTPRKTTVIICIIFILNMGLFSPEYATAYYDWKFLENTNRTVLGLYYTSDHAKVGDVIFLLYSILGFASFVAVVACTLILVVQLNRKTKWRMTANSDKRQMESACNRDRKTMSMVAMIAIVLIICYTPGVVVSMVTIFESEFSIFGAYVNLFYVMWSFAFMGETLNSSINIFFYYHMSMNYRETLHKVIGRLNRSKSLA